MVRVRYFAAAAEAAGCEEQVLPEASIGPSGSVLAGAVPSGSVLTVGDVRRALVELYGDPMARVLASGSFLVDGVVSRDDSRPVGSTVDVLPPFAGG